MSKQPKAPMGRDKTTPQRKKIFLAALREHGVVKTACECADINNQTPYAWRKSDKTFFARWEQVLDDAITDLELIAHTKHAPNDPYFAKWLLAMRRPNKYNKAENIQVAGEIKIEIVERAKPKEED